MKKELKTTEKCIERIISGLRKEENLRPHSLLGSPPQFTRYMERVNLSLILGVELFGIISERWDGEGHDESEILPVSYAREQFLKMIEGGEIEIVGEDDIFRDYGIKDYSMPCHYPNSKEGFVKFIEEWNSYSDNEE
jgi:hypothetical protein